MKRNKGFTLIELLAIISILTIILLIAVPTTFRVIDNAKEQAFKNSILSVIKSADYNYQLRSIKKPNLGEVIIDFKKKQNLEYVTIKGTLPISGTITLYSSGEMYLLEVSDGKYYATGGRENFVINKIDGDTSTSLAYTDSYCFIISNNNITGFDQSNFECKNNVIIPEKINNQVVKAILPKNSMLMYTGDFVMPDSVLYLDLGAIYADDGSYNKNMYFSKNLEYIKNPYVWYTPSDEQNENGFIYPLNKDGSLNKSILLKYIGKDREIEIPEGVKIVFDGAFEQFEGKIVKVPNSLTKLNWDFFNHIKSYEDSNGFVLSTDNKILLGYNGSETNIVLPNVKYIGDNALSNKNLTNVEIPNSVIYIGESSFSNNEITNIQLPNSLKIIENYSFSSNNLTTITIPNSVSLIGESAFSNNQLTSVNLPDFINYIANYAFTSNPIKSVKIPGTIYLGDFAFDYYNFESDSDFVLSEDKTILFNYVGDDRDITIPEGVKYIANRAFEYKQLNSVVIPNSVTAIGDNAFSGNNLTNVVIPNSVTAIGRNAFYNNQLTNVTLSNSLTSIEEDTFASNQLKSIVIPNSVTVIGRNAFYGNHLTSVTLSNSLASIGEMSFAQNQLKSIVIPNSVKNIGNFAFERNQLTNVVLSNTISRIGDYAFAQNQLTNIDISDTLTHIGYDVFYGNDIQDQNGFVLSKNKNILLNYIGDEKNIVIPDSVVYIASNTFSYKNLEGVVLPKSIKIISENAFSGNQLTNINLPNSITVIGKNAFYGNKLTNIDLPNSITSIEEGAFASNKLKSIVIPDSVTVINRWAFDYNEISNLVLSNNLIKIGENAFLGNKLTNITIPNSVKTIERGAFSDNLITTVDIPSNVTTMGEYVFGYNESQLILNIYGKCDRFDNFFEYYNFSGTKVCK